MEWSKNGYQKAMLNQKTGHNTKCRELEWYPEYTQPVTIGVRSDRAACDSGKSVSDLLCAFGPSEKSTSCILVPVEGVSTLLTPHANLYIPEGQSDLRPQWRSMVLEEEEGEKTRKLTMSSTGFVRLQMILQMIPFAPYYPPPLQYAPPSESLAWTVDPRGLDTEEKILSLLKILHGTQMTAMDLLLYTISDKPTMAARNGTFSPS
ncbi:hypothetical protein F4604DRAFT_1679570 [Suillus subluteus]|nr:hypothetical protein F4604DRAFT_1679570 [Suillus subluteus]